MFLYKIKLIDDTIKVFDIIDESEPREKGFIYATQEEFNMLNPENVDTSNVTTNMDI